MFDFFFFFLSSFLCVHFDLYMVTVPGFLVTEEKFIALFIIFFSLPFSVKNVSWKSRIVLNAAKISYDSGNNFAHWTALH